MTDEQEERAVQELTARIVRASIERCKVFNMRMPQLEQLEGEEEDDEKVGLSPGVRHAVKR